ncbi:adenylyltransferase [candidate division MSBL1 archaeon SCGC-AAA382A13]|uniref:Adenylyltransferase n=1 Tax=candidate division MSBL1 archaeon SCGC-AAA382A13 TaxID=1698279 RepID=A0A133VH07_9EURY|nr:adenylyltransferase [candidate division MSBL1 archaeon SCGC-AAA382A13]
MQKDKPSEELTDRDKVRYDRQIMIKNFGEEGQKKLKSSTALIAGVGGLGSPVSIYLAIAGLGKLKIVDKDKVELSNLNRQILYRNEDVGKYKANISKKILKEYNPDIEVESFNQKITSENISDLARDCDLIVDCMDNYPTRYLLNEVCLEKELPLFHAAVSGMNGQATTIIPGETPCLKCIVPNPPPEEKFPVLGATPGLLGTIQAHEVIKYIVGIGKLLKNQLLLVREGTNFRKINVRKNPKCEACGNEQILK